MTDCLSCVHAHPALAPTGEVDFSRKICKRFPPVPVVIPGPGGPSMQACFPVVGKGVSCAEHAEREPEVAS